ncbi:LysR family transcriptional regulator [Alcaligenaceae bacterium]|nr:LysR family transcriptional regulator [Alcaligenaceae bacterium]
MRKLSSQAIPSRITGIRIRQLQLFQMLIDAGSISEAARRCHMTQPAATEIFKELERAFAAQLFVRGTRGIALTPAGESLARHVTLMLRELQLAALEVESAGGGRPPLRLGFVSMAMERLLPRAISMLRQIDPAINISMKELNVLECSRALLAGDLDAAVTLNHAAFEPSESGGEFMIEILNEERYSIAASHLLDQGGGRKITLAQAQKQLWILPSKDAALRRGFDDSFLQKGLLPPESVLEMSPISHGTKFLDTIPALTLTPEKEAPGGPAGGWHLLNCAELEVTFRLVFVCRSEYRDRLDIATLFNCLRKSMSSMR